MPKVIGSASGNNLKITIPARGEKNWDELIENSCFTPISNHSHTGNGDGAKIDTDALEDGAVTNAKLESAIQGKLTQVDSNTTSIANLQTDVTNNTNSITNNSNTISAHTTDITNLQNDITNNTNSITNNSNTISTHTTDISMIQQWNLANLNDVASTAPTSGQVLSWNGTSWTPATSSGGSSNVYDFNSVAAAQAYSPSAGDVIIMSSSLVDLDDLSIDLANVTIFVPMTGAFFNNLTRCNVIARGSISVKNTEGCNITTEGTFNAVATDSGAITTIKESTIKCNDLSVFVDDTQGATRVIFQDVNINASGAFSSGFGDHLDAVHLGTSANITVERLNFGNTIEQDLKIISDSAVLKVTGGGSSTANIYTSSGSSIASISNVSEPFEISNLLYKNSSGAIVIDSSDALTTYGSGTPGDTLIVNSSSGLTLNNALEGIKIINKDGQPLSINADLTSCDIRTDRPLTIFDTNISSSIITCSNTITFSATGGAFSKEINSSQIICDQLALHNDTIFELKDSKVTCRALNKYHNYVDNSFRVKHGSELTIGHMNADFGSDSIGIDQKSKILLKSGNANKNLTVENLSTYTDIYSDDKAVEIIGYTVSIIPISATAGDMLIYNGTAWEKHTPVIYSGKGTMSGTGGLQYLAPPTAVLDTTSSFSTNQFTVPEDGYYKITISLKFSGLTSYAELYLYQNGNLGDSVNTADESLLSGAGSLSVSYVMQATSGDTLAAWVNSADTSYSIIINSYMIEKIY